MKIKVNHEKLIIALLILSNILPFTLPNLLSKSILWTLTPIKFKTFTHLVLYGNSNTATKWLNTREISFTGDITGSAFIDGSTDIPITITVVDNSHNHLSENKNHPAATTAYCHGDNNSVSDLHRHRLSNILSEHTHTEFYARPQCGSTWLCTLRANWSHKRKCNFNSHCSVYRKCGRYSECGIIG